MIVSCITVCIPETPVRHIVSNENIIRNTIVLTYHFRDLVIIFIQLLDIILIYEFSLVTLVKLRGNGIKGFWLFILSISDL